MEHVFWKITGVIFSYAVIAGLIYGLSYDKNDDRHTDEIKTVASLFWPVTIPFVVVVVGVVVFKEWFWKKIYGGLHGK